MRSAVVPKLRSVFYLNYKSFPSLTERPKFRADIFALDLEDSVPQGEKQLTRDAVATAISSGIFAGGPLMVRLNSITNPTELVADLTAVLQADSRQQLILKLPKIQSRDCVKAYETLVSSFESYYKRDNKAALFIPTMEDPIGVQNAMEIAKSSSRVVGLGLGGSDFMAAALCTSDSTTMKVARCQTAMVARALNIQAIDAPFTCISDIDGLERECIEAKHMGFTGKIVLHPRHLAVVNHTMALSDKQFEWVQRMIPSHGVSVGADGHVLAPPIKRKAAAMLRYYKSPIVTNVETTMKTVMGVRPTYGVNPTEIEIGKEMSSPYEITLTEATREKWQSKFFAADKLYTSRPFARHFGLRDAPLPFGLMFNLALGMSVDVFSESCKLHFGIKNAVYEQPCFPGDTLRNSVEIIRIAEPKPGNKYRAVDSRHTLHNQNGERVFSVEKTSGFDENETKGLATAESTSTVVLSDNFKRQLLKRPHPISPTEIKKHMKPLKEGQLILHPWNRPIGISENLDFCNWMRNTHSSHFDYERYPTERLIVSGGYLFSAVLALASREFRDVLYEEVLHTSHMESARPMDCLGAISYVLKKTPIPDTEYEEVIVRTIGTKKVDAAAACENRHVPMELFDYGDLSAVKKPREYRQLCEDHLPNLQNKLILQVLRKLIRPIVD